MLDVVIEARKHLAPGDPDTREYLVVKDGRDRPVPDTEEGILEIPEDYYLEIRVRYPDLTEGDLGDVSPEVTIGDETYYCRFAEDAATGVWWWTLAWRNDVPHVGRPFFGLVGFHEIRITSFAGREEEFDRIVPLEVLATEERANEITAILGFVDEEYEHISQMCLDARGEPGGDLADVIGAAEQTYAVCRELWAALLGQLRHRLEPELSVTHNGLPNSPGAIHWLSVHGDAMALCSPDEQMFRINNIPVKTDFAAEEHMAPSYGVFENLVIAGFFSQIRLKLGDILDFIGSRTADDELSRLRERERSRLYPEYIRYRNIVRGFSEQTLKNYREKVVALQDGFFQMFRSFRRATGIGYRDRPMMPRVTPFVARTLVYRKLFEQIGRWYGACARKIRVHEFAAHFIKIDKLYEFMVLSRVVSVVSDLGGVLQAREWHDMEKDLFGGRESPRPESEPFNYYRWLSENQEYTLELWYEPRVRTWHHAAPGDPMVVASENYGRNFYYTPDFAIRITWNRSGLADYLIADAKYSSADTVRRTSLPTLVTKYMRNIRVKSPGSLDNGIRGILAVYARGRDDFVGYYAREHRFAGQDPLFPAIDAVAVRPEKDNEKNLREYLSRFIGQLRKFRQAEAARIRELAARIGSGP